MKKQYLFFITTTIAFLILSCNKTDKISPAQNKQLKASDFEIYGKVHNKQLHDIYIGLLSAPLAKTNNIRTNGVNSPISNSQALEISKNVLIDEVDSTPNISTLEKGLSYYSINSTYAGTPVMEGSHIYTASVAGGLTSSQIGLLDELSTVIQNIDIDNNLSVTQNKITAIENEVPSLNLAVPQQSIIYIATNVAKSSILYWNDEGS